MKRLMAVLFVLFPFLLMAMTLLWTEHRAHLLGALPWLFVAVSCVLLVVSIRRRRGHDGDASRSPRRTP